MSEPTDDKPSASLNTSDLKARLGLKRRTRQGAEDLPGAAVEEARRKADAAHDEAGVAEENFTLMGQDKTPPPQPLPQREVKGFIEIEGQAKSKLIPLLIGLALLGGIGFGLGNVYGTASSETDLREGFIDEARQAAKVLVKSTSKGAKNTKLERWLDTRARLGRMSGRLQELTSGYGGGTSRAVVSQLVSDDNSKDRVGLLVAQFQEMLPDLFALYRAKNYFSPESLSGDSVKNPVLMREVMQFGSTTKAFHDALGDSLGELGEYKDAYLMARIKLYREGLKARFQQKRLYAHQKEEAVQAATWKEAIEDKEAADSCSATRKNLTDAAACMTCCQETLKKTYFDTSFNPRKRCGCERASAPLSRCRNADEEAGVTAIACPAGYQCADGGACLSGLNGPFGDLVTLDDTALARFRNGKWFRTLANGGVVSNKQVVRVNWDSVTENAATAYAQELVQTQQTLYLTALGSLSAKANRAQWYGSGNLREKLAEWACKSAGDEAPASWLDCDGSGAKAADDGLQTAQASYKTTFEEDVKKLITAREAKENAPKASK